MWHVRLFLTLFTDITNEKCVYAIPLPLIVKTYVRYYVCAQMQLRTSRLCTWGNSMVQLPTLLWVYYKLWTGV